VPDYRGDVHAPDFPPGAEWLNTGRPLTMRDLRGKVVLLDFWTFCCINCMHILADLKKLEHKYAGELVVVGVHSAKFSAERVTENVRQAVLRYQIEHPVVNDPQMWMWRQYGVRAWPSVVLIDPEGKVIGGHSGEGIYAPFDQIIGKVIEVFDAEGAIDRRPLDLAREDARAPRPLLSFPGKVLADDAGRRLFIADSNHDRIVVASLDDGSVEEVISGGFRNPQGMALDGDHLYIADTDSHAIRRADLRTGGVETVADGLNSPWDLVLERGVLYIAMAGPHQLWRLDLATGKLAVHAGSGREGRIDGPLDQAALAQPSGISTDGAKLYFADSETSSIRSADIDPRGRVSTIVGVDLFEFGDADGMGDQVRLQHPLGVVWSGDSLYVADTYNNKVKQVFAATRSARTIAEGFDHPSGLAAAGGRLYVADTNSHRIRIVDLATGEVSDFELKQIGRLAGWRGQVTRLDPLPVKPGPAEIILTLELAAGHHWNPDTPAEVFLSLNDGEEAHVSAPPGTPIRLPFEAPEGGAVLRLDCTAYYCGDGNQSLCLVHEDNLEIPLDARADAAASALDLRRPVGVAR